MPNINVLPDSVSNLIAAGEVVERPASVVKELVENSIDAGSTEVKIEVAGGGLKEIVITDDGSGMDSDDLKICICRHATSKLRSADDLEDIKTMGFRGEALPSIAAVSKVMIESKPKTSDNVVGHRLVLDAGTVTGFEEKGLPTGTRIRVSDLFYNVPARMKFARTPRTELGHIKDTVQRLALANPEIRFKLTSDGRALISADSVGDTKQRAFEIFGSDVVKNSYECEADAGEIRVYGLVGDPSLAKDGSKGIYWFVNRRPIRDRLLSHALSDAYRSLLPRGFAPFSLLFLNLPPGLVDVNVHPTKSEVKFLKGNAVHDFVSSAVKRALTTKASMPVASRPADEVHRNMGDVSPIPRNYSSSRPEFIRGDSCSYGVKQPDLIPKGEFSSLRAIGQLHNSFLLCEKEGGALVVIDQHAAHERIGYEKLKESYFSASVQSQGLLVPEVVSVSPKSVGYLESALDELNKIGWELEYFGGDNFCAKAVPAILGNINLKSVIAQLADDLSEYGKMDVVDDRLDLLMKVTACHAQIRAGDRLSNSEIEHLLKEMDGFDWSGRCPHGRPAVAEINLNDIEKWFNRT